MSGLTQRPAADVPISGGYFITRAVERDPDRSPDVLPTHLISLSACIAAFMPGEWALPWGGVPESRRLSIADDFGIAESELPELAHRVQDRMSAGELGWPCVWHSVEAALEFAREFGGPENDWLVVGAGLDARYVDALLEGTRPHPGAGMPGIHEAVSKRRHPDPGGHRLGWELLGCDGGGTFHSWLCHGLEIDASREYGIVPNEYGLIASRADADAVVEHCRRHGIELEPGFWAPWQLVRYGGASNGKAFPMRSPNPEEERP